MRIARVFRSTLPITGVVLVVIAFVGCPQFTAAPWPVNYVPILTDQFVDPVGDEVAPVGSYPSVDVTDVALGISDDYLYIRVDFSAPIPTSTQDVSGVWPAPSESVKDHGFSLDLNVDGQPGIDVFFRGKLRYGGGYMLYVMNGVIPPSLDPLVEVGELGEGGSGFDYLIARFDVLRLGDLFPRGTAVAAGFNASAEAVDQEEISADTAWDFVAIGIWTIPN